MAYPVPVSQFQLVVMLKGKGVKAFLDYEYYQYLTDRGYSDYGWKVKSREDPILFYVGKELAAIEYIKKWEIKRDIFKDKSKALELKRKLRKRDFLVKTKKNNDGREDYWEITGRKAK